MNNFDTFKENFKRDILIRIVVSMRNGSMGKKRSKNLAREILDIFSESEPKKIFARINKLSESNPDILDVFIKRMNEFDTSERGSKMEQIMVILKPNTDRKGLPADLSTKALATVEALAKEGGVN